MWMVSVTRTKFASSFWLIIDITNFHSYGMTIPANHIVYCSCPKLLLYRHLDLNQELFWFYPSFSKASSDMPTILWTVIIIRMTPSTIPWDHCRTVGGFRTSSPRTRGGNYISWSSGLYHKAQNFPFHSTRDLIIWQITEYGSVVRASIRRDTGLK